MDIHGNIKNIVFWVLAVLVVLAYSMYLLLVGAIGSTYPSSRTGLINYLYVYVPVIPLVIWFGFKRLNKSNYLSWLLVVSPILWVLLSSILVASLSSKG